MPDELRIHEAFQNGDLEAVALAVGEGFPSCRLPFQSTSCLEYAIYHSPLPYAASQDDAAAIELLVAKGADLNARSGIDDYATPLEEAENLGRAKAVKALSRARQG